MSFVVSNKTLSLALLLDSLKDHGSLTKQEIVRLLLDVLPDQLEDKQKMNRIEFCSSNLGGWMNFGQTGE